MESKSLKKFPFDKKKLEMLRFLREERALSYLDFFFLVLFLREIRVCVCE